MNERGMKTARERDDGQGNTEIGRSYAVPILRVISISISCKVEPQFLKQTEITNVSKIYDVD